jgi:preprotein translocase subunit SecE
MISKLKKIPKFFGEVKEELKKVNWSTKEQIRGALIVVMVVLAFLTLYVAGVDLGLSKIMRALLHG